MTDQATTRSSFLSRIQTLLTLFLLPTLILGIVRMRELEKQVTNLKAALEAQSLADKEATARTERVIHGIVAVDQLLWTHVGLQSFHPGEGAARTRALCKSFRTRNIFLERLQEIRDPQNAISLDGAIDLNGQFKELCAKEDPGPNEAEKEPETGPPVFIPAPTPLELL